MAKLKDIIAAIATETVGSSIPSIVADYLIENPPSGGLTIDQIKADTAIAGAITNSHALQTDNQDLSNLVVKESGKGLSTNDYTEDEKNKLEAVPIIIVSATEPSNPVLNQIWIDIS